MLDRLKDRCSAVISYDDFTALAASLSSVDSTVLFEELWKLSLNEAWQGTDATVASFLLAKLEPMATRDCEKLLREISVSSWDLSNKVVPFYLVAIFGKRVVLETTKHLLANSESEPRTLLEGVIYWLKQPTDSLIEPLHYFEWQEAIEGESP